MHPNLTVPHLKISQPTETSPLEKKILENQVEIEAWFREQWHQHPPLITASVDLRHAGYKLAAVDTNVFPAGFNNLNTEFLPLAVQAVQSTLSHYYPDCKNLALIAESHTRNLHYLENLLALETLFQQAGYHIKIGTLRDIEKPEPFMIGDKKLIQYPLTIKDQTLFLDDYRPCLVLSNHDFSEGVPPLLRSIEQPIIPSLTMSWAHRSKYQHFVHYQNNVESFCKQFNLDPWFFVPAFEQCKEVDFTLKTLEFDLVDKINRLFTSIQTKYDQYGIEDKPFVVMKADAGTYGMAVMMLKNPEDIHQLNRKQRNEMATTKGGATVSRVLLQEGVYSHETVGTQNSVAEPVIYMIGEYVIGGFYRVHTGKTAKDNLNAPGMHFEPLAFAECCNSPDQRLSIHDSKNQFYIYSVVARLAQLSAALETEQTR